MILSKSKEMVLVAVDPVPGPFRVGGKLGEPVHLLALFGRWRINVQEPPREGNKSTWNSTQTVTQGQDRTGNDTGQSTNGFSSSRDVWVSSHHQSACDWKTERKKDLLVEPPALFASLLFELNRLQTSGNVKWRYSQWHCLQDHLEVLLPAGWQAVKSSRF